MQRYIDQLVEDLNMAAKNPPPDPYVEVPPNLEEAPEIAELATSPFITIEELTGIKEAAFPPMPDLHAEQCRQVNQAIFKLFESLKIELVDVPEAIPPEWLYDVLTTNWQHYVQYLPSSGMDLELCTGEPMTCPYGEYCDCDEPFDEFEIPIRFSELLHHIASSIDAGFACFLDPESLEMEEIPKSMLDDPCDIESITGIGQDDYAFKHKNWKRCFTFEPLESSESFRIMEAFADQLEDKKLSEALFFALGHKRPFAQFKSKIEQSSCRQDWYDFKQKWLEDHVKQIIFREINSPEDDLNLDLDGIF
jgi:hypothetical protein